MARVSEPAARKAERLSPDDWVHSTGKRALLEANRRRLAGLPARLSKLRADGLGKRIPELAASLDALDSPGLPERLLASPCLDGWLALAEEAMESPPAPEDIQRRMLLSQLDGFAAALALSRGGSFDGPAILDHEGHFHLHGLGAYVDFGKEAALRTARLTLGPDAFENPAFHRLPQIMEGIEASCCDPLLLPVLTRPLGPKEHGVARLSAKEFERYVKVLRRGIDEVAAVDPLQAAELCDSIKVIVPLERLDSKAHVSSTYSHLRGAIFLCHDDDAVLQGETLVHEFCHDKLNALLAVEPIFKGGESEALYFSPWRPDPRTLRGIMLGAHAFLNVARYLRLAAERKAPRVKRRLQTESAMRCLQVDAALSALEAHAKLTPYAAKLVAAMRRSLDEVISGLPPRPGGLWGAASEPVNAHAAKFLSPRRWFHAQSASSQP